jgi:hypothetical protein
MRVLGAETQKDSELISKELVFVTMHSSDSSDDEMGQNTLPAGVLRSRGGWADANNIEVQHQRERLRAADNKLEHNSASRSDGIKNHTAVDLSQFRNEEVGIGYKAKHVVRQREASSSAVGALLDMSGGTFSSKDVHLSTTTKQRGRGEAGKDDNAMAGGTSDDACLNTYLKCKGMRDFIKEIDKILKPR